MLRPLSCLADAPWGRAQLGKITQLHQFKKIIRKAEKGFTK